MAFVLWFQLVVLNSSNGNLLGFYEVGSRVLNDLKELKADWMRNFIVFENFRVLIIKVFYWAFKKSKKATKLF